MQLFPPFPLSVFFFFYHESKRPLGFLGGFPPPPSHAGNLRVNGMVGEFTFFPLPPLLFSPQRCRALIFSPLGATTQLSLPLLAPRSRSGVPFFLPLIFLPPFPFPPSVLFSKTFGLSPSAPTLTSLNLPVFLIRIHCSAMSSSYLYTKIVSLFLHSPPPQTLIFAEKSLPPPAAPYILPPPPPPPAPPPPPPPPGPTPPPPPQWSYRHVPLPPTVSLPFLGQLKPRLV